MAKFTNDVQMTENVAGLGAISLPLGRTRGGRCLVTHGNEGVHSWYCTRFNCKYIFILQKKKERDNRESSRFLSVSWPCVPLKWCGRRKSSELHTRSFA